MAEALAAFGLAANIIQFSDIGSRLVSTVWSIYKENQDGGNELSELEVATKRLESILATLVLSPESPDESSDIERSLRELSQQCCSLATEMLKALHDVYRSGKARKRDAVRQALKIVWKEDEIKSQKARLEEYKHQLTLHLLATLRNQARKSLHQQELILSQLATVHEGTQQISKRVSQLTAEGIGASILDFLTAELNDRDHRQRNSWQMALITAICEDEENSNERDVSGLSITPDRRRTLQSAFIARLQYNGMEDREERIADPYEETFQWIFGDPEDPEKKWSNFREWLESSSQLYWITGKAGSGKSTLMKYICHQEHSTSSSRYEKYLKEWAAGSQLVTATYFFWNSGIQLQMSKMGLLRSLLTQIMRQCPDLIPSVSPNRWESLCLFNDDPREWFKEELERMLLSAVEKLLHLAKLCLFVDGLDEFDGEHADLICLFQSLIINENVKICVASRPWVLFEDAFQHRPSLTLQDFNYNDIKLYVSSNLHNDPNFAQLRAREPMFAEDLVENVVSKASGVFLWVHLVVASLLAGIGYGDRVSDLQRRLDFLPPDLEDLYDKILQSLDPFYLEHAAQLFKLVEESISPPSLLLLSFADEEQVEIVLKQPMKALTAETELLRAETMRRRLNSRCKGLLEVRKPSLNSLGTVQYLHRTVKDYVQNSEVQAKLQSAMKSPFDPHLRFCAGKLALVKATNHNSVFLNDNVFWTNVEDCLCSASKIEPSNRGDTVSLLDELDRTGRDLVRDVSAMGRNPFLALDKASFFQNLLDTGQWVLFHPVLTDAELKSKFGGTFLSLATHYGVVEYIKARAMPGCLIQQADNKIWPLLADALHACDVKMSEADDTRISPAMIKCLLDRGADPNFLMPKDQFRAKSDTIWQHALKFSRQDQRIAVNTILPYWSDIARLRIDHGADVSRGTLESVYDSGANLFPFVIEGEGRYSRDMKKFNNNLREIMDANLGNPINYKTSKAQGLNKWFAF